ncbi:MAG TPA: hypothetical protein VLK84_22980 [Longimicrobium sp.]|nr:hypothetical protein [Longimicrobium sp.]
MPVSLSPRRWPVALAVLASAACGSTPEPQGGAADSLRAGSPPAATTQAPPSPSAPIQADPQAIRSVRTSLKADDCTMVSVDEEAGGSTQRCPGTAGYTLLALDGDARASITLVDRAGREHPLEFWTTITGGFTSLGDEAEWRVRGEGAAAVPVALIVPLRANEHPDDPERLTPYRVISKITSAETCVTHALDVIPSDDEVRRLADASASAPCRKSYSEP